MQRDAGDESTRLLRAEFFRAEAPHRQQCEARDPQRVASGRPREARRRAYRRYRSEQSLDEPVAEPAPTLVERAPRIAVSGRVRVERRGRLIDVGREDRAGAVPGRMREHDRRASPPQPILLEPQSPDDWRCRRERIERAEHVVHEAGFDQLGGPNCTAGL
jgi:hypothetical protein